MNRPARSGARIGASLAALCGLVVAGLAAVTGAPGTAEATAVLRAADRPAETRQLTGGGRTGAPTARPESRVSPATSPSDGVAGAGTVGLAPAGTRGTDGADDDVLAAPPRLAVPADDDDAPGPRSEQQVRQGTGRPDAPQGRAPPQA